MAPWKALHEVKAKLIAAEGDATILPIQADAQSEARDGFKFVPKRTDTTGFTKSDDVK